MPYEVVNTSAPRGLVPGQSGYCDVLRTDGTPQAICAALAPMSRYDERLSAGGPAVAVRTIRHGGQTWGVITRTVPSGADYTGRANRLAHHLVVEPADLATVNPAAVVVGFAFRDRFDGEPCLLQDMPVLPTGGTPRGAWTAAGLSGWDGAVVRALAAPGARVVVALPAGVPVASLVSELLTRLPHAQRWELGVCTGCDAPSAWNDRARLRMVLTPEGEAAPAAWPGERLLDLRGRPASPVASGAAVSGKAGAGAIAAANAPAPTKERWVTLAPEPVRASGVSPIEVSLGASSEAIDIGHFDAVPAPTEPEPPTPRPERVWGIVCLWLGLGAVVGALVAFILASALRHG